MAPTTRSRGSANSGEKETKKKPEETPELVLPTDDSKRRSNKSKQNYDTDIFQVLNQVRPNVGISSKAMKMMNKFVNGSFDPTAAEITNFGPKKRKRSPPNSKEIQTIPLPGELS